MEKDFSVVIIGLGNDYRRDDGVGLYAARRIRSQELPGVRVVEGVSDGTSLIDHWEQADSAYVIDAVRSDSDPGTILRFDALSDPVPVDIFPAYSSHAFNIAEAVALARELGKLPRSLIVYGIEGRKFSTGMGLSSDVKEAAEEVSRRIVSEMGIRRPH